MYDIVSLKEPSDGFTKYDASCEIVPVPLNNGIDAAILKSTRVLHTGSSSLVREPARSLTYESIDIAKHAGAVVSYAPNRHTSLWPSETDAIRFMRSLICTADILLATEAELLLLTGESEPEKAADALADQGVRVIIIPLVSEQVFLRVGHKSRMLHGALETDRFFFDFLCQFIKSEKKLRDITIDEACDFTTRIF